MCVVVDSDITGFIRNVESQDIKVEMMSKPDYMSSAPVSAAINVTGFSKVRNLSVFKQNAEFSEILTDLLSFCTMNRILPTF